VGRRDRQERPRGPSELCFKNRFHITHSVVFHDAYLVGEAVDDAGYDEDSAWSQNCAVVARHVGLV
jgi:hypothetical protein